MNINRGPRVSWEWAFLALLLLFIGCMAAPAQAQKPDWSGDWDSTWRNRGARITLTQTGDVVRGGYRLYQGTVEAKAVGRELSGVWWERGREGKFVAIMSADEKTFTARFGTGEWITGIRVEADDAFLGKSFERVSPASVMHEFLSVMNAVGPGRMELLSEASHFIDFSQLTTSGISELEFTQILFAVLDKLTFRVWGIQPESAASDLVTANLSQAGTGLTFALSFAKSDGQWLIVPPHIDVLRDTLQRLKAARSGVDESPNGELSSARATIRTLVHSFASGKSDITSALSTLNMSGLSALAQEYEGPKLARYLNRSLQRLGTLTWQEITDDPTRTQPYVHFEHPYGAIALARISTEKGTIWQFTPETLQNIRAVYAALDNIPPNHVLQLQPQKESLYFRTRDAIRAIDPDLANRWGPMELWQWLGLALVFLFAIVLGKLLDLSFYALVVRHSQTSPQRLPVIRWLFLWSFLLLAVGISLRLSDKVFSYPDIVQVVLVAIGLSCLILSSMMLILLATGLVVDHLKNRVTSVKNHITLVSFVAGIFRIAVVVLGILLLAHVLQVPYQSVLAGLGLGGLAVALAAQPTLQNFISGITLYFDKPIAVGDYCRFGDKTGTIEFIGLRSTRIRTLDRTVLTIPNSEFSNMQIENYAKRDRMLLNATLRLRYETTPDQIRLLLAELRRLLPSHPKVAAEPIRIRFEGFGEHSLDISIFAYILSSNEAEFIAIREDIYLHIMQLIEQSGNKMAAPSKVMFA